MGWVLVVIRRITAGVMTKLWFPKAVTVMGFLLLVQHARNEIQPDESVP